MASNAEIFSYSPTWAANESEIKTLGKAGSDFVNTYRQHPFREFCVARGFLPVEAKTVLFEGRESLYFTMDAIHDTPDNLGVDRCDTPLLSSDEIAESVSPGIKSNAINTSQLHLPGLLLNVAGILNGDICPPREYGEEFTSRVGALLFADANIGDYLLDMNRDSLVGPDPQIERKMLDVRSEAGLNEYLIHPESYYAALSEGFHPTTDIHDVVHHGLQNVIWSDFYNWFYRLASSAEQLDGEEGDRMKIKRFKDLVGFLTMATSEYSQVGESLEKSYSFGCLPWQYPRKSPIAKIDFMKEYVEPKEYARWTGLRVLSSLKRREMAVGDQAGSDDISWFEELGYRLPYKYQPQKIERGQFVEAVSGLPLDHEIDAYEISMPESPEELFYNAERVLEKEIDLLGSLANQIEV